MQIEMSKCDGRCKMLTTSDIKEAILLIKTDAISIVNKRHLRTDSSTLFT